MSASNSSLRASAPEFVPSTLREHRDVWLAPVDALSSAKPLLKSVSRQWNDLWEYSSKGAMDRAGLEGVPKATHTAMSGGNFFVPPSEMGKFLAAHLKAVRNARGNPHELPTTVERVPPGSHMRFFMDIDVKLTPEEQELHFYDVETRASFISEMSEYLADEALDCFDGGTDGHTVLFLGAAEELQGDGSVKVGVHVVFPDLIVNHQTAESINEHLIAGGLVHENSFIRTLLAKTIVSENVSTTRSLDPKPFKNGGLRLTFSGKSPQATQPCIACDDHCIQTKCHKMGYGAGGVKTSLPAVKLVTGRPYVLMNVMRREAGDLVEFPEELERLLDDPLALLGKSIIVQPVSTPFTEGLVIPLLQESKAPSKKRKRDSVVTGTVRAPSSEALVTYDVGVITTLLYSDEVMAPYRDAGVTISMLEPCKDNPNTFYVQLDSRLCPSKKQHNGNRAFIHIKRSGVCILKCHKGCESITFPTPAGINELLWPQPLEIPAASGDIVALDPTTPDPPMLLENGQPKPLPFGNYMRTHLGAAEMFYDMKPHAYRYHKDLGWYALLPTGAWEACGQKCDSMRNDIALILSARVREAMAALTGKRKTIARAAKELFVYMGILQSSSFVSGIMTFLVSVYTDKDLHLKMDETHRLFAFKNCVVDMEAVDTDGSLLLASRPILPSDYICINTGYDCPSACDPAVRKHLDAILMSIFNEKSLVDYVLRTLAQLLHGKRLHEEAYFWLGAGGNGKSLLSSLLKAVFGSYYWTLPVTYFTKPNQKKDQPEPGLAMSRGRRIVVVGEPEAGDLLQEGTIKFTSGNDEIAARTLNREPVPFLPQWALFFLTNQALEFNSLTQGGIRRFRQVPFKTSFKEPHLCVSPGDKPLDKSLKTKLQSPAYRNEFLFMLVQAYTTLGEDVRPPTAVTDGTADLVLDNNPLAGWLTQYYIRIDNTTDFGHRGWCNASDLLFRFKQDTHTQFSRDMTAKRMGALLAQLPSFVNKKIQGRSFNGEVWDDETKSWVMTERQGGAYYCGVVRKTFELYLTVFLRSTLRMMIRM